MTTTQTAEKRTNYEIFLDTINTLRYSQGFYGRLASQMDEIIECEPEKVEEIKEHFNKLPQWSDNVDCIFYLEC
jgi:hypothetical protein